MQGAIEDKQSSTTIEKSLPPFGLGMGTAFEFIATTNLAQCHHPET